jgi:hypothetical protein
LVLFVHVVYTVSACAKGNGCTCSRPTRGDRLLMWYLRGFSGEEETPTSTLLSPMVEGFGLCVGSSRSEFVSIRVLVCDLGTLGMLDLHAFLQRGP